MTNKLIILYGIPLDTEKSNAIKAEEIEKLAEDIMNYPLPSEVLLICVSYKPDKRGRFYKRFDKLDKDRKNKKCEYAIIVTTLEADNELYNNGIVDVSYKYPKMYVIRPQFFIPMISLLRNASLKALDERRELIRLQNQNIDIKNFEDSLEQFKTAFAYNYNQANKRFVEAIDEIDKTIDHLNKVKAALMASDRQLRLANDKASDVTLKRLAKNSPSIQKMSGGKP